MKPAIAVLLVLLAEIVGQAHTLDEYLQAARVQLRPTGVALYVDLTPGVNIAEHVIRRIDSDDDTVFSAREAEAYGRAVLSDLELTLDGATLSLSLLRVEVPTVGELREGQGVIRVETLSNVDLSAQPHHLTLHNSHLSEISVYLANALLPDSADVRIVKQTRDQRQQTYRLDFEAQHTGRVQLGWLVIATSVFGSLIWVRRSSSG